MVYYIYSFMGSIVNLCNCCYSIPPASRARSNEHEALGGAFPKRIIFTSKVDVALSKASRAADAEKFLLEEVENLGKAMKCESSEILICFAV
jgi:hypothetical protein